MKWFRHDSNAHRDKNLRKVVMKYGMEGYGLYWHCIELIASSVEVDKITFELEHDSEIISHDTGISRELVEEMMTYMVNLGLFQSEGGIITCLQLAKRLDKSMTSNPNMRKIIGEIRENHDSVMTKSPQIRLDKIRLNKKIYIPDDFGVSDRVIEWAAKKGYDRLEDHLENFILVANSKGYKYANWDSAFMRAIRDDWAGLRKKSVKTTDSDQGLLKEAERLGIKVQAGWSWDRLRQEINRRRQ